MDPRIDQRPWPRSEHQIRVLDWMKAHDKHGWSGKDCRVSVNFFKACGMKWRETSSQDGDLPVFGGRITGGGRSFCSAEKPEGFAQMQSKQTGCGKPPMTTAEQEPWPSGIQSYAWSFKNWQDRWRQHANWFKPVWNRSEQNHVKAEEMKARAK